MRYHHRFTVDAPLEAVRRFHASSKSLQAITPPLSPLSGIDAPETLGEGDRMAFTLWFGPLPIRWVADIADVHPQGFTDTQHQGPFAHWQHHHRFEPVEDVTEDGTEDGPTVVDDTIEARLRKHPLWGPIGLAIWLGLPALFAYRAWATRRALRGG